MLLWLRRSSQGKLKLGVQAEGSEHTCAQTYNQIHRGSCLYSCWTEYSDPLLVSLGEAIENLGMGVGVDLLMIWGWMGLHWCLRQNENDEEKKALDSRRYDYPHQHGRLDTTQKLYLLQWMHMHRVVGVFGTTCESCWQQPIVEIQYHIEAKKDIQISGCVVQLSWYAMSSGVEAGCWEERTSM